MDYKWKHFPAFGYVSINILNHKDSLKNVQPVGFLWEEDRYLNMKSVEGQDHSSKTMWLKQDHETEKGEANIYKVKIQPGCSLYMNKNTDISFELKIHKT